jgi:hypothetical protein
MRTFLVMLVLSVVGLVSGCAITEHGLGVEEGAAVQIVWHQVSDPHKTCQEQDGQKAFYRIKGCSNWTDDRDVVVGVEKKAQGRICHIWSTKPESSRDTDRFVTLGHEVMHCFEGNWHDQYGRYNEDWHRAKPKLTLEEEGN